MPSDAPQSNRELVAAWLDRGDQAAACALMQRLYPQVAAIARRHLPQRAALDDMTQEVFAKLFSQLNRYDPALPLENWVSRLALNTCLDRLRQERRRPEVRWADLTEEQCAALHSLFAAPPQLETVDHAVAGALLDRLLATLEPADRLVIRLTLLEGRSVAEIARQTGWGRSMVKVRAFRARLKLRRAMAELERGTP